MGFFNDICRANESALRDLAMMQNMAENDTMLAKLCELEDKIENIENSPSNEDKLDELEARIEVIEEQLESIVDYLQSLQGLVEAVKYHDDILCQILKK